MGNKQSLHQCDECANKSAGLEVKFERFASGWVWVTPSGLSILRRGY